MRVSTRKSILASVVVTILSSSTYPERLLLAEDAVVGPFVPCSADALQDHVVSETEVVVVLTEGSPSASLREGLDRLGLAPSGSSGLAPISAGCRLRVGTAECVP